MSRETEVTELPVANPEAELPAGAPGGRQVPQRVRVMTLVAILAPLIGVISAPLYVWGWGFGWTDLTLLLAMYILTALGITVGFHRLFVHRSFETYTWVKVIWAILGSMAVQGSLFQWVGLHRKHHQFSDTPEDPHTPHHRGEGVLGALRGFWHAHIGWFFATTPPDLNRYVKDISSTPSLRAANNLFALWAFLGLLIPGLFGWLLTFSLKGFVTGVIWGGLIRLFLVHHVTWSVNSACHLWGRRPFKSDDMSRNNFLFGILALGEGWHNTHHAFPTSARHGLRWWELDVSYWVIKSLALMGLAWNLKLPSKQDVARERRHS